MDDQHFFAKPQGPAEVVLGVYGTEDWIFATELRKRYLAGKSTLQLSGSWLTTSGFDLKDWAADLANQELMSYTFFGSTSVCLYEEDGSIVKARFNRGKLDVELYGDIDVLKAWEEYFDKNFRKAESLVSWVYNSRGDEIHVPLNYRPAIHAAYPWIQGGLDDYIDDYLNSDASVLILIGPPGTGKTTFIKNLIHRSKANAKVAYDPKVLMDDGFFASFIGDDSRFLVMEDADEFLKSRTEGNTMMHKFLNVSDGLISAADKKIVFSVNLENVGDIDTALLRPGRCFDVLQFRPLTRDEAEAVLTEVGSDRSIPDGQAHTLAELFATQPSGKGPQRRKMGF